MILIADSGSTKTTWCLHNRGFGSSTYHQTAGINPYYQTEKEIIATLEKEFDNKPGEVDAIYFYGAGCANAAVNQVVHNALFHHFGAPDIEVESDLMAAARSLCGHRPGIACILGTGSNSCYYDGKTVAHHVPPLGFMLGDEGSGGVLGRKLLSDILKNILPDEVVSLFYETCKVTSAEIMENIYRKPFPNRYAAQFTAFIYENISLPGLSQLVLNEFDQFFRRNVMQYPQALATKINFTGSIAYYFAPQLKEAAASLGLQTGKIVKEPIKGLIDFHLGIDHLSQE